MILYPGKINLVDLQKLYLDDINVEIDPLSIDKVEKAAKIVNDAIETGAPIYGVNTGFGKLANKKIKANEAKELQKNLILSHCAGVGDPLDIKTTRLMMLLKLLSLAIGASGVKWSTIKQLEKMINANVIPLIPHQGSVGASGDLAPLAHMTSVMIGEGWALYKGQKIKGIDALSRAGINPIELGPKEGLALINGTQFSTACALSSLFDSWNLLLNSIVISSITTDAIMGSTSPLLEKIHKLRGQKGQIFVAQKMRELIQGSVIRESHREDDDRVQDPYCIRCQPQVLGACFDVLRMSANTLEIEANAVTDNPLVLVEEKIIVSGGNFHGEPIGFAADKIALSIAEMGSISQRRVALMVDPGLNFNLPPFLTDHPGLNSGFMVAEVTTAALMSENKHLANPCVTDSTPTSANQEDHVSMSAHAAYRLFKMNNNLSFIFAIELICSCQGVESRLPLLTSKKLQDAMKILRAKIPRLENDRYLSEDINLASEIINKGDLLSKLNLNLPISSLMD